MPGIKISNNIKKDLPPDQQKDVEERLWEMSSGQCYLCGETMNRATDDIEADHDEPVAGAGKTGATKLENLNLAHKSCNAAKKNNPTVDVRPYLKLDAFIKKHTGAVRYGECTKLFGIAPKPVHLTRPSPTSARFELPGGTIAEVPVFRAHNSEGDYDYCFVELPRESIFNDEECQPRNIKKAQAWAIFLDLQKNPLHEPPGCRVVPDGSAFRLLMFDGQHKTIASWMNGYQTIVAKIYLNLTLQQTTRLVNSVQAKIKKLPLSPFEVAAKLGDEWEHRWAEYEALVGTEKASEDGFPSTLKQSDRRRGAQAFQEARMKALLDRDDFSFLKFVKRAGISDSDHSVIQEGAFKSKVLKTLVYSKPIKVAGEAGEKKRTAEADNIIKVLNYFSDKVFEPGGPGVALSAEQLEVRRRFSYQGSLKFTTDMLQKIVRHFCALGDDDSALMEADINDARWTQISEAIDRLIAHPIWHKKFDIGPKASAVENALSKNQQVKESMKSIGLTVGYLVGVDTLPGDWYK